MENSFKISIPKPCHEEWDKMNPESNGRFCSSCTKTVVDFTAMKTPEIQQYFKVRQGERICGRFKNTQLESLTIQIPQSVLFIQTSYRKSFLLALFVTMGNMLFSCSDENGNRKNIDGVEVVSDSEVERHVTLGMPMPSKTFEDTLPTVTLPAIKKSTAFIKTGTTTGDVAIESTPNDSVDFLLKGKTHIDTIPQ